MGWAERVGRWLVLGAALALLYTFWHLVPAVALAVFLALALERPAQLLERATSLPRPWVAALVLGSIAGMVAWVGVSLGAQLAHELLLARRLAPELGRRWEEAVRAMGGLVGPWSHYLGDGGQAGALLSSAVRMALGALSQVPRVLGTALWTLVLAYLLLAQGPLLPKLSRLVPSHGAAAAAWDTLSLAIASAWRLARAELTLALGTGVASAGLFALLGARVPLLLGAVAALCDLIPYVGPALLFLPWSGYLFLVDHAPRAALAIAASWLCLAGMRGLAELLLVGRGIGLSPLWVLVSFYVGGRLAGVPGFFLGPVVAAAAWGVWQGGGGASQGDGKARQGGGAGDRASIWAQPTLPHVGARPSARRSSPPGPRAQAAGHPRRHG